MSTKFNPFIFFNGNCEQAFNSYKQIFGGDFTKFIRYNDTQHKEGVPAVPQEMGNQLRHISLPLNNDTVLMGCDNADEWNAEMIMGSNVRISITTDSRDEADRLYNALAEGGTEKALMSDTFWGSYYGSLIDKFGVHWMIEYPGNTDEKPTHEDNANIHIP